jgi:hypothetical protein
MVFTKLLQCDRLLNEVSEETLTMEANVPPKHKYIHTRLQGTVIFKNTLKVHFIVQAKALYNKLLSWETTVTSHPPFSMFMMELSF